MSALVKDILLVVTVKIGIIYLLWYAFFAAPTHPDLRKHVLSSQQTQGLEP